ncbi:MAG: dehydrogenase [Pelagibacteraceae bacterium BACL5 MAG-121015-bin10]|nr:MAG: dehydrogenase [Pelagibacteraceae bacterium BACL5 MAG-121015-bin10]
MNRLLLIFIAIFLLNNCSFNENSRLWKDKEQPLENQENVTQIFAEEQSVSLELNPDISLDLSNIKSSNKIVDNQNNFGPLSYNGTLQKNGNFKFSKLENLDQFNLKPAFLNEGIIFFDNKGSVLRFNDEQKIIWKNNFYSKSEKKLKPKLNFAINNEDLIVVDNIAKYFSINLNSGELNWIKNNSYPFNSDIKIFEDKFFAIDYKNTLRCFKIMDGSECWNLQTEDSFTISNSKFSLIILDDKVIFNNSIGDITAVDIKTGLIAWQLPTQSSSIINETYNFKISKLVSDGDAIFFSNNKNEFYSIDVKTGTTNWINKINSNLTPILTKDLIFTVSNEGFLFTIQKNTGNIIRINYLYKDYKEKKRKELKPIGFVIGNTNIYISNNDGKLIVVDLSNGKVNFIEKIGGDTISEPFIVNQNLYLIKSGSIVRYN